MVSLTESLPPAPPRCGRCLGRGRERHGMEKPGCVFLSKASFVLFLSVCTSLTFGLKCELWSLFQIDAGSKVLCHEIVNAALTGGQAWNHRSRWAPWGQHFPFTLISQFPSCWVAYDCFPESSSLSGTAVNGKDGGVPFTGKMWTCLWHIASHGQRCHIEFSL